MTDPQAEAVSTRRLQDDIEAVGSALVAYDETTRAPKGGSQP